MTTPFSRSSQLRSNELFGLLRQSRALAAHLVGCAARPIATITLQPGTCYTWVPHSSLARRDFVRNKPTDSRMSLSKVANYVRMRHAWEMREGQGQQLGGRRAMRAMLFGVAILLFAPGAFAPHFPVCPGIKAVARPGPIEPGVAAILLTPNELGGAYSVRLLDADGTPIPVVVTPIESRYPDLNERAFIRATERLEAGEYTLEYSDEECTGQGYRLRPLPITIASAQALPSSLGQLVATYETYCEGATREQNGLRVVLSYPPILVLDLKLDDSLTPYWPFMRYRVQDELGREWANDYAVRDLGAWFPIACVPTENAIEPGRHTFTALGELLDGPVLTAVADVDLECASCPSKSLTPATAAAGAPTAAGLHPVDSSGCSLVALERKHSYLQLLLLFALRRRRIR